MIGDSVPRRKQDLNDWLAQRRSAERVYEKEQSQEFFADPNAKIPDLVFEYPDCPICTSTTNLDGEYWYCDVCEVLWPANGNGSEAERYAEDA